MKGGYFNNFREGSFEFYYPNGQLERKGIFTANKRIGIWKYYYKSGSIKQIVLFQDSELERMPKFIIINYYDKCGQALVKNGEGKWKYDSVRINVADNYSLKTLSGSFKDSLMHGRWELVRISGKKLMKTETFRKGELLTGQTFVSSQQEYRPYPIETMNKFPLKQGWKFKQTESFVFDETAFPDIKSETDKIKLLNEMLGLSILIPDKAASYKGGDRSMFKTLAEYLRYPVSAQKEKIEGTVYVELTIDSKGEKIASKITKGVQADLDEEALRVIDLLEDKWDAAVQNGKQITSTLTIPIKFSQPSKN